MEPDLDLDARPSALVLTVSRMTTLIFVSDAKRLGDAALALSYHQVPFRPIRNNPAVGGYTCLFGMSDEDPFETRFAEKTAAILDDIGLFAVGYEIFHDHTVSDTDAFHRPFLSGEYDEWGLSDYGTAFLSCAHLLDRSEIWVFGHPERLRGGLEAAEEVGIAARAIEGPNGPLTLTATFPDRQSAEEAAQVWSDAFESVVIAPFAYQTEQGSS